MPCWEMNTMSVEFSANSLSGLKEAASRLGMGFSQHQSSVTLRLTSSANSIVIDFERKEAVLAKQDQRHLNALKREYSEVILEKVAAKKRWILKKKNANSFQMKRT